MSFYYKIYTEYENTQNAHWLALYLAVILTAACTLQSHIECEILCILSVIFRCSSQFYTPTSLSPGNKSTVANECGTEWV
jgi:hypothetical protein